MEIDAIGLWYSIVLRKDLKLCANARIVLFNLLLLDKGRAKQFDSKSLCDELGYELVLFQRSLRQLYLAGLLTRTSLFVDKPNDPKFSYRLSLSGFDKLRGKYWAKGRDRHQIAREVRYMALSSERAFSYWNDVPSKAREFKSRNRLALTAVLKKFGTQKVAYIRPTELSSLLGVGVDGVRNQLKEIESYSHSEVGVSILRITSGFTGKMLFGVTGTCYFKIEDNEDVDLVERYRVITQRLPCLLSMMDFVINDVLKNLYWKNNDHHYRDTFLDELREELCRIVITEQVLMRVALGILGLTKQPALSLAPAYCKKLESLDEGNSTKLYFEMLVQQLSSGLLMQARVLLGMGKYTN